MMQKQPTTPSGTSTFSKPSWWKDDMTSNWDRAKAALRKDWEQTKHDLSRGRAGRDTGQDVGDTVKQTMGKEPVGKGFEAGKKYSFDQSEDALRYGYGAASYYGDFKDWDDAFENKLREDWKSYNTRPFDEVREDVKYGWTAGRKEIH